MTTIAHVGSLLRPNTVYYGLEEGAHVRATNVELSAGRRSPSKWMA